MQDRKPPFDPSHAAIDPERPRPGGQLFDADGGYSGEDYTAAREQAEGAAEPSGSVDRQTSFTLNEPDARDIPPDNGRRAFADPDTGEVHGSGAGAGGGNEGEDFDTGSEGGSGPPLTGRQGTSGKTGDLGPAHLGE